MIYLDTGYPTFSNKWLQSKLEKKPTPSSRIIQWINGGVTRNYDLFPRLMGGVKVLEGSKN